MMNLMMSSEAAHGSVPLLVHAVVKDAIRLSDRHEALGTTAGLRDCSKMAIAWAQEARGGVLNHLMMSFEAAHGSMPMLVHAVVRDAIPLSDRHAQQIKGGFWHCANSCQL